MSNNNNLMNLEAYEAFKRSLNIFNDLDNVDDLEPSDLECYIEPYSASTRYGVVDIDFIYDLDDEFIIAVIKRGGNYLKVDDQNEGSELYRGVNDLRFHCRLIQDLLPSLTPFEREFIMTGIAL